MSSSGSIPRVGLVDASLLAVALVWGSTYLVAKELVGPSTVVAVLALRFLERLSTAETAEVLGLSPGAVRLRVMRALDRLRDRLGGDES